MRRNNRGGSWEKKPQATSGRKSPVTSGSKASTMGISRLLPNRFAGTQPRTITRDEIYHRLEWYFNASHDPAGTTHYSSNGAYECVTSWVPARPNCTKTSIKPVRLSIPPGTARCFMVCNSLDINAERSPGVKDIKTFGDLINCVVGAYGHAGWKVTDPSGGAS